MADISVNINTPQLDGIIERLEPGARAELHHEIAAEIQQTVQGHLRRYALAHHKTASGLGARPTGNLEDAKVEATSDSDGATVTVAALGIRRALGPVEIRPRNKQALTIPVAAIAYGRSVAYLKAHGVDVFRPKGKNYLAYKENPKSQFSTVIYILAKRAALKHEPELLPGSDELEKNAIEAARDYIMEESA
ncbi:MAG: hypothetical protein ACI4TC_04140 [Kiritimatiellia bacterium]